MIYLVDMLIIDKKQVLASTAQLVDILALRVQTEDLKLDSIESVQAIFTAYPQKACRIL